MKPDDDLPEITDHMLASAELRIGERVIRRGRPPLESPKQAIKLRLDAEVVEHFRETGPGWQTRINEALRRALKADEKDMVAAVAAATKQTRKKPAAKAAEKERAARWLATHFLQQQKRGKAALEKATKPSAPAKKRA